MRPLKPGDTLIIDDGQEANVGAVRAFHSGVLMTEIVEVTYFAHGRINNRTFRYWRWLCGPEAAEGPQSAELQ